MNPDLWERTITFGDVYLFAVIYLVGQIARGTITAYQHRKKSSPK